MEVTPSPMKLETNAAHWHFHRYHYLKRWGGVWPKEDRHLLTGLHTVADISCADCREVLGWKYERAYEASQKYKEGKFILEKSKIVKENW
ncbi:hypothetical protein LWI29_018393 [Acer saccharum]|uniref:Protein yippee-like n=1 Tax=Acer saccharum TaxID=4024 RepID=A0AA39SMF7_ACESA|nr:hypothetical protein LWI29_018393 [Acer saccharum]